MGLRVQESMGLRVKECKSQRVQKSLRLLDPGTLRPLLALKNVKESNGVKV